MYHGDEFVSGYPVTSNSSRLLAQVSRKKKLAPLSTLVLRLDILPLNGHICVLPFIKFKSIESIERTKFKRTTHEW